jgi:hypothetical protein
LNAVSGSVVASCANTHGRGMKKLTTNPRLRKEARIAIPLLTDIRRSVKLPKPGPPHRDDCENMRAAIFFLAPFSG